MRNDTIIINPRSDFNRIITIFREFSDYFILNMVTRISNSINNVIRENTINTIKIPSFSR